MTAMDDEEQAPEDLDPLGIIGTIVDEKYRILALCGEGGYSAVYKAEHLVWSEPVALKFFTLLEGAKPELRDKLLSDFIQEGKLMTQLSSRSAAIVQARDIGKLALADGDWIPFMVLEWLEGPSLNLVVKRERATNLPARTPREVMNLLEPVAIALDLAHQSGIAHRDLKPANIVIMGDPRAEGVPVKVLDFGIAKVMADHQQLNVQLQQTGQQITAFTPNYGAPEQFSRNFGATGPWTDVFAMALILVELLQGGVRALQGASFFELGVKSCDATTRPTPRALGVDVSDAIEAVFDKALALQPKDRYATMGAFWDELHRHVFAAGWMRPRQMSLSGMRARGSADMGKSGMSMSDLAISARPATPSQRDIEAALGEQRTEASLDLPPIMSGAQLAGAEVAATVAVEGSGATLANLAGPAEAPPTGKRGVWLAAVAAVALVGVGAFVWLAPNSPSAPTDVTSGAAKQGDDALNAGDGASDSAASDSAASDSAASNSAASNSAASDSAVVAVGKSADGDPPIETSATPAASATANHPPVANVPKPPVAGPKVGAGAKGSAPSAAPKGNDGADPWDPNSFGGRR